jgi:hypothetical protein
VVVVAAAVAASDSSRLPRASSSKAPSSEWDTSFWMFRALMLLVSQRQTDLGMSAAEPSALDAAHVDAAYEV